MAIPLLPFRGITPISSSPIPNREWRNVRATILLNLAGNAVLVAGKRGWRQWKRPSSLSGRDLKMTDDELGCLNYAVASRKVLVIGHSGLPPLVTDLS